MTPVQLLAALTAAQASYLKLLGEGQVSFSYTQGDGTRSVTAPLRPRDVGSADSATLAGVRHCVLDARADPLSWPLRLSTEMRYSPLDRRALPDIRHSADQRSFD
jgi:hypothetical protein